MMIDPPIDKMVDDIGCKYALVCLVTKRARYLIDKKADLLESTGERPITLAAREVYEGKVIAKTEGN